MDGIFSGLASIVPIMPEQSTIADKGGVNGPPVEIMPLPSDSFMSDSASAELLNNPFNLSLDIKGYSSAAANGGRTGGKASPQENDASDALLSHAYTLSLGGEENTPVAAEIAREMSRMKNYELLGKHSARMGRMMQSAGDMGNMPEDLEFGGATEYVGEKVRGLLSQVAAGQMPALRGEISAAPPLMQDPMHPLFETPVDDTAGPRQNAQGSSSVPVPAAADNMSLLSRLAALRLSASDIEAILALEPEMQETMLNMLGSVNADISGKPPAASAAGMTAESSPDELAGMGIRPKRDAAVGNNQAIHGSNILPDLEGGGMQEALHDIPIFMNRVPARQTGTVPGETQPVALTEDDLTLLTAGPLISGTAQGNTPSNTLRGAMANLQKISELPYSLYIFGNVSAERKDDGIEEEEDIAVPEQTGAVRTGPPIFLRLSEAIKMASVLHNIYYGGSGRFPLKTPWYAPYVRYAVRNGIIQDGEFRDYNDFATREEAASIFSRSVPKAEFPIINYVTDIPDVAETIGYGESIYLLHRAGVLVRGDKTGGFHPELLMTKTEAVSIIGRIATPSDRKRIV